MTEVAERRYFQIKPERFFTPDDLLSVPPPVWLIEDHLIEGTVSMMFGEWGAAKSFMALDMAGCVSQGILWHGRKTQQVDVLYVASEGHPAMLGRRLEAWKAIQGYPKDYELRCMVVYADLIDMDHEDTPRELLTYAQENLGLKPQFVIIDTLSMAVGGDQNDNALMSNFIKSLRKYSRWQYDEEDFERPIHWMVIHHTGHENRMRPRGGSSFLGDFDTILGMTFMNVYAAYLAGKKLPPSDTATDRVLFCAKQKDAQEFDASYFEIKSFSGELGDAAIKHKRWDVAKGEIEELTADDTEKELLELVRDAGDEGIALGDLAEKLDLNKTTVSRRLDVLEKGKDAKLERINDRPRITRVREVSAEAVDPDPAKL